MTKFCVTLKEHHVDSIDQHPSPLCLGRRRWKGHVLVRVLYSSQGLLPEVGIVEVSISPGDEPPLHVHKNEDEWFYVLDGEVTFHVGNENYRASVGGFVSFPRDIPHTFTVESPNARFLVMNTPGGFERMFELAPKTIEDAVSALKAFDIEVVGPHPREAAAA